MTIRRIIGGKGFINVPNISIGEGAKIHGIVDFDDSSMYSQILGTPVLFTTEGEYNLSEDEYELLKPYCDDIDGTPLDLNTLPNSVLQKLHLK